jgi:hypothetical protein
MFCTTTVLGETPITTDGGRDIGRLKQQLKTPYSISKLKFKITRYSLILPFSTVTEKFLICADLIPRIVFAAFLMA